jgi:foldase protein PrsA
VDQLTDPQVLSGGELLHMPRARRLRLISALSVTLLAVIGVSACGGIAGEAVVEVNGTPITKAAFDHWMGVAATASKASAASKSSVLAYLISADWLIGEASSLGIRLSDAEVRREFVKDKVAQFPEVAKFEAYLKSSGESVSDLLLSVKLHLLGEKVEQRAVKGKSAAQQQAAFTAFLKQFKKKWAAKTECAPGYIVADCKQYKPPKASRIAKPPKG